MNIDEMMVKEVVRVSPDETIGEAARRMLEKAVGCPVVTVPGAVKGIMTDRDLLDCLVASHQPDRCTVAAHMRRPVIVLGPDNDPTTAAMVLRRKKIKRLPVARQGKLLGIVSLSDLAARAGREGERLRSAADFLAAVVGAQAAQSRTPESGLRSQASEGKPADGEAIIDAAGARSGGKDALGC
jgi:signal-transduction protein with cAMP-binding, CBS, and nucleotidyltransferase domain